MDQTCFPHAKKSDSENENQREFNAASGRGHGGDAEKVRDLRLPDLHGHFR